MRIQTNVESLNAYRNLSSTNRQQSQHMERLSSGFRINRAADDAAGLSISEQMRGQIGGLDQATENAQDATSLIQTAEGALNESHEILQRMRELSVQSANDTLTEQDRGEIQNEVDQLAEELTRIAENTEFNTQELLDGEFEDNIFHIGANEGQNISLDIGDMRSENLNVAAGWEGEIADLGEEDTDVTVTGGSREVYEQVEVVFDDVDGDSNIDVNDNTMTINLSQDESHSTSDVNELIQEAAETEEFAGDADGAEISNISVDFEGEIVVDGGTNGLDGSTSLDTEGEGGIAVDSQGFADAAITTIDNAITQVSEQRGELGAVQNRLEHTVSNLEVASENLQAAESRIRDTDMAQEMTEFTTTQILEEAGTAMLAQANQAPQNVLQLLG